MSDDQAFLPHARLATAGDLVELVRLNRLAREHFEGLRGGVVHLLHSTRPEPVEAVLRDRIDSDDHVVVVGCLGEVVVGHAVALLRPLADGTVAAELDEIFVEHPARGVGVGWLLMERVLDWAVDLGCVGIDARVLPGDRSTKNFFEANGLVARAITVHRDLRV